MNTSICDLTSKHCKSCEGGMPPLTDREIATLISQIVGWELLDKRIGKTYAFKNYYRTMAFVNAVAWVSHCEDHHPDMIVSYNKCRVEYTTHAINGLSENDFICAAKVDALFMT